MPEFRDPVSLGAGYPLAPATSWLIVMSMTVLTAPVVLCVMIGMDVARWDPLQDPRGRGALLSGVATCSPGVGAFGGLSLVLVQLDQVFAGSATWSHPLFHASGVVGMCGWLALLALASSGPHEKLGTACALLSVIGRCLMAAYLSQTLLSILVCGLLISLSMCLLGAAVSGLTALVVWILISLGCVIAETMGSSCNPAERTLYRLVTKSAKKRPMPISAPTPVVRSDVSVGVMQVSSLPVAPISALGVESNGDVQRGMYDSE